MPYLCRACHSESPTWLAYCMKCESWDTFKEGTLSRASSFKLLSKPSSRMRVERIASFAPSLDEVLGGGLVPFSVTLLGGEPGIGKSTLLLQWAASLKVPVLYASGEELTEQIEERAHRLSIASRLIEVGYESSLTLILERVKKTRPEVLILDSLQVLFWEDVEGSANSPMQLREMGPRLMSLAKHERIAIVLVSQVTKDGDLSGPKAVEHSVDTVLHFEAKDSGIRVIRSSKNRFGRAPLSASFEMTAEGLKAI